MKQTAQQLCTRLLTLIMAGVAGTGAAAAAAATGTGINAQVDTGADVSAPDTAPADGAVDAHISMYMSISGNAQSQNGAAPNTDRAAERMSTHSAEWTPSAGADLADADQATAQRTP
jgi:hypothetical protein